MSEPRFPQRGAEIIDALYNANRDAAHGDDDQRRGLTRKIIEQLVFEFPSDGYGWKSSTPNNPPSKDAIARQSNGRLYVWDWQHGASRERQVKAGDQAEDVTGQHFIAVGGLDHLDVGPGTQTPPPVVGESTEDDRRWQVVRKELTDRIEAAKEEILAGQREQTRALIAHITRLAERSTT